MGQRSVIPSIHFTILLLIVSGCRSVEVVETPSEQFTRVLEIQDRLDLVKSDLESQCLRREGFAFEAAPPVKNQMLLSVSESQFPSEQLLAYTDEDLAELASMKESSKANEYLRELSAARTIEGSFFEGGCQQWAKGRIRASFSFALGLESLESDLSSEIEVGESKERAELNADWSNCLTGEARSVSKEKGYADPSILQLSIGLEALRIATQFGSRPREARRLLAIRGQMEKVVIVEARRCALETSYFRRFNGLRSSSLAKVLDDDSVRDALNFDIQQIKIVDTDTTS